MGVKYEKEPLVGIFPVKLFFDKSLDSMTMCQVTYKIAHCQYSNVSRHRSKTHRTCSLSRLVRPIGIFPDKLLLLRRLVHGAEPFSFPDNKLIAQE